MSRLQDGAESREDDARSSDQRTEDVKGTKFITLTENMEKKSVEM